MSKIHINKRDALSITSVFIRKPLSAAIISALASTLIMAQVYAADSENPSADKQSTDKAASDKSATDDQKTNTDSAANTQTTTPAAQDENRLSSVVVTAQKREESAQNVATSISVLDGKELLDKGIGRSASEVLNYVPNASAGTQQHGRPRWWIRGVGAGQQQIDFPNPVGFYQDDVYISNASATGFPLFDIDRVEVLRGPQGTLWGKNTTGGAINVLAKKPTFSGDDNYFKTDYGTYNDKIIEGAIGGSIIDERIAGRLSVHDENQDGRFNNLFKNQKDGSLTDSAIRGQLLFELTPDLEALLNVHYRNYKTNGAITTVTGTGAGGAYINGYIPSTNINDVSTNAPDTSKTTQNGVSLNLKWQLGQYALTSITGYEDFGNVAQADSDFTPLEIGRTYNDAKSRQISQEFRLASPREDRLNWLTGFHFFKEDIDSYSASARLPNGTVPAQAGSTAPTAYSLTTFNHKTESYAIFGSSTYNFTEQFNTTLGLRWTTEEKKLDLNRLNNAAGGASWSNLASWWNSYTGTYGNPIVGQTSTFTDTESKRWDALTYDLTPEYKLTQTDRVYFKFAHGVKSGGFNTAATTSAALNTLSPENLNSYELGYKSEWLDGRLNFNANVFHYDYKNAQVNIVGALAGSPTPVSYLQNVTSSHVNGAEFEVEALPTNNLHINANIGLLETKFDDFDILNGGGNRDGNQFVRSPHFSSLLAADYKIPLDNGRKVVVGGDWRYLGDQFYFVDPQNNPLLNQEAYSIVNARVTYSTAKDRVAVTGYVNNLTDENYHNHALPGARAGAVAATGAATYWANPRTAGISVTLRF
ncbi:MAG: TonB-dependent receptor [Methylophilaceae bacterium]|nr:TonB-dependent receptor [Methyloradius sp.]